MQKDYTKTTLALMIAMFVAILWGFQEMLLRHAPSVFRAKEEDMSFAWYVPLFSLYVLWSERKALKESLGAGSWTGFLLLIPALLLGFIGARGLQVRFEIAAFSFLAIAIPWISFGAKTAKKIAFPALFLLFCIPLATFLDVFTVHLRLFVTSSAHAILQGFGADVVRRGTMLASATPGGFEIDVAEPCSGLRSIFALMALTAAYAYFNQKTWIRRGILFALSIPIAVFGNMMRILTICVVANCASKEFATGFYHDYSGYVVFIAAILMMVATSELISKIAEEKRRAKDEESAAVAKEEGLAPVGGTRRFSLAPIAALAAILPVMVYQAKTPEVTIPQAPEVRLYDIPAFESVELEPSKVELDILPADTKIEKRRYVTRYGQTFTVTLVTGGASKSSIHRPELCLPSQGYLMREPRTIDVDGIDWRFIVLENSEIGNRGFSYTFFNQEGFRTSSHSRRILQDTLDRTFFNRIDRWVMVTVESSIPDEEAVKEFLALLRPSLGFFGMDSVNQNQGKSE